MNHPEDIIVWYHTVHGGADTMTDSELEAAIKAMYKQIADSGIKGEDWRA